jgi:tetratricopeptide (TPR) repeat protein
MVYYDDGKTFVDGGYMRNVTTQEQPGEIVSFDQTGEYFFSKGLKAFHRNDFHKSRKYLERAIQYDPTQTVYVYQLAIVLGEIGEYSGANELLQSIVSELKTEQYDCYYYLANNYAHLGLFQEAKNYAYEYLTHAKDGNYIEETHDLLELLNIEGDDLDLGFFGAEDELLIKQEEATTFLEKGEFNDAISLFQEITEEYPEFWAAHNNLALAYFYSGNEKKAIALIEDVLQKNEGNLHACCNLTIFYYYMGLTDLVEEMFIQLEKVSPIDVDYRYKLGATFAIIGKYENAFQWLRHLYAHQYEGDAAFYYWLSIAAYYCGNEALSQKVWEIVIKLTPDKKGSEPWLNK